MQKYRIISKLGSGAFGSVEKAENRQTKEIVAIKKLKRKYSTWDECVQLAEVKALRKLMHPNIIRLRELIRLTTEAYFIFEYIDRDLYKLCQSLKEKGRQLSEPDIKNIAIQIAQALAYIHKQGFFHRDLKPENLLISQDNTIKLIDFGLAKEIRSKPPFTEYVSTRWYRAPEILLRSPTYSAPVDVFAFGCVLAELYLMKPLFMGNSEIDQLNKICSLMGTPTSQDWPDGIKLASLKGYNLPQYSAIPLASVITNCSSEGINLITECLKFDPTRRINMNQVLNHPYFKDVKVQIKPREEERVNPFDKLEKTKVSVSDISEHEFDAILNGFSKPSEKAPESKPSKQKIEEEVDFGMPRLRLVEPILHKQPKNTPLKDQHTHSLSPSRDFPFSKPSNNSNQKVESEFGGYMPSFGASDTGSRFKKGGLGMIGLQSMNKR